MIFPEQRPEQPSSQDHMGLGSDVRVELKYVLSTEIAIAVRAWARQHLQFDEHTQGSDGYPVRTLYLDTDQGSVFHRQSGMGTTKYRVRRYGAENVVWLEAKHRRGDDVTKQRLAMSIEQLPSVDSTWRMASTRPGRLSASPLSWRGSWFEQCVDEQGLRPTLLIDYHRVAHVASSATGPCRLTVDSGLMARPHREWSLPPGENGICTEITAYEVLELKFRGVLPGLFRCLLSEFEIKSMPFSKYRSAARRCGLFAPASESCGHVE